MKKNQIISIIIGVLILIGLASSFSYWLGQKSVEVKSEITTPNPLESKVIQSWEAVAIGEITEIGEDGLAVKNNEESISILIGEKTVFREASFKNGEKQIKEINFEDIKTGDRVNIEIGVDQVGKIWATSVTILPE